MAVEMEGLEFQIETKTEDSAKGIESLTKSLSKLKNALKNIDTSKLESLGKALETVSKMGELKISASVGTQLGKITDAMSKVNDADVERLERLSAALTSLSSVGDIRLPKVKVPAAEKVAEVTAPATNSTSATNGVAQAVNSAQEISASVQQATQRTWTFRSVLGGVGGVFKKVFSLGVGLLHKVINGFVKVKASIVNAKAAVHKFLTGNKLAAWVKNVTSGLGQLFSSFRRIAMYRMVRFALSTIVKAFKEGVQNLYQYSNAMGGAFAASMNSAASNALYLKNSLGAMAAPIVNALAPAIDYLSGKIVGLLNLINMLIARLSGGATFTAAKKIEKSYGDAFGGAAGAAKDAADKIKSYTTGIDELNIINETPDSGGGGGGGGADFSSMFEELPIDNSISDFADRLREAFDNADWESLGSLLGGKLNKIIDGIDFSGLGKKIGFGINGAVQTTYHFLDTVDFTNIGKHIAEFVNAGLEEWDTSYWGRIFVKKFTFILDLLIGAVSNLDWSLVGQRIGNFFTGAFDEVSKWLGKYDWSEVGTTLWTSFINLVTGINWSEVASSMAQAIGSALGAVASLLGGLCESAWEDVKSYFKEKIAEAGGNIPEGLWNGITEALGDVATWIKTNIFEPFIEGFKNCFGIHSPSTVMEEQGGFVSDGLLNGIAKPFKSIGTWVDTNILQPFINAFKDKPAAEFKVDVKNDSESWWQKIKNWFTRKTGSGMNVDTNVSLKKSGWTTIKDWIGNIPTLNQGISLLKSGWTTVRSWIGTLPTISQAISLAKSGWSSVTSWIGTTTHSVGVSLWKDGWTSISSWIGSKVSVGISLFKDGWTSIKSWFGLANGGIVGANGGVKMFSSGGSLHNGAAEFWNAIPKYAGGTANAHGSMFVAGERGAELVGHVNGRTEVLNKSQLGQVMHRSIVDGMAQFAGYWAAVNTHMSTCTNAIISAMFMSADAVYAGVDTRDAHMAQSVGVWMDNLSSRVEAAFAGAVSTDQIAEGVREGMYEVSTRQNDLLREQNDLLLRLLNKNTTVQIGNKAIKDAVVTQDNADGYRFTK